MELISLFLSIRPIALLYGIETNKLTKCEIEIIGERSTHEAGTKNKALYSLLSDVLSCLIFTSDRV